LIFFTSRTDGRAHETFTVRYVAQEEHPEFLERFRIAQIPAIVVVEDRRVRARLEQPRGCDEIQTFLAPWLR
jgi:thioredoxin-like negative regulator of GroEL